MIYSTFVQISCLGDLFLCVDNSPPSLPDICTGRDGNSPTLENHKFVCYPKALYYDWRAGRQRPSCTAIVFCAGVAISAGLYAGVVVIEQALGVGEEQYLTWLDFLYFLSYVKVCVFV